MEKILRKLCECGCGNPVPLAPQTDKMRGWIKGEPIRFIYNHHLQTEKVREKNRITQKSEITRRKKRETKLGPLNPNWKGDNIKLSSGRLRASRNFKISNCKLCGDNGYDRHHIDKNPINNKSENIQILCRRCHMIVDGRTKNVSPGCRII